MVRFSADGRGYRPQPRDGREFGGHPELSQQCFRARPMPRILGYAAEGSVTRFTH